LKTEFLDKLLVDFFDQPQAKSLRKLLSGTEKKNLTSYLKDSDNIPVFQSSVERRDIVEFDLVITFAKANLKETRFLEFLLSSGDYFKSSGDFDYANNIYGRLISLAENNARLNSFKSHCYLAKADIFQRQARWEECLVNLKKARKEFDHLKDKRGSARCENLLGTIYGEKGNIKRAKLHFERSLSLLTPDKDRILTGMLEVNLGIINNIQGNFDQAFSLFQRALVTFEQVKDLKRLAEIRHNLGMLFTQKGEYDSALVEFDKSLSYSNKYGYTSILALTYLSKAFIYTQLKDFYLANAFADKAMELTYAMNDRLSMADIYKIKGIIEKNLLNFKLAENFFLTSIRINQEYSNELNLAESSYELGLLYREMGEKGKAKMFLDNAAAYYKKINAHNMLNKLKGEALQL
jgi:tetratricopeptide (TPR) repeat protein